MSNSWGHQVRPLTADELFEQERRREWGLTPRTSGWGYCYAGRRCSGHPTHRITYLYRQHARVTKAWKDYCRQHAEAFAAKHGLQVNQKAIPA